MYVLFHNSLSAKVFRKFILTLRNVSSWLSATPEGKTAVTNPLGSGRRKCIGSGTSTVVPVMCWSMTFSMSFSWWNSPSNRAPKALQQEIKVFSSLLTKSRIWWCGWLKKMSRCYQGETYSLTESLQEVATTQSIGSVADRKWAFWDFLQRIRVGRGPGWVTSIIRRMSMTVWIFRHTCILDIKTFYLFTF